MTLLLSSYIGESFLYLADFLQRPWATLADARTPEGTIGRKEAFLPLLPFQVEVVPGKDMAEIGSGRIMDNAEVVLAEYAPGPRIAGIVRLDRHHIGLCLGIINLSKVAKGKGTLR